jgi:SAM-dependent methyltransferase
LDWRLLAVKDAIKAAVPFQAHVRRGLRSLRPYRTNPDNDRLALENGEQIWELLLAHTDPIDRDFLEVGSGWIPILPTLFTARGAGSFFLADQDKLMDAATRRSAALVVKEHLLKLEQDSGIRAAVVEARLARAQWRYDPNWQPSSHPSASQDIVISRAVLEHVRPALLQQMLVEFRRILRPGGVMCHLIDNSDHWQHRDRSISRINFLRFGDAVFALAGLNQQNYQSRLRHSDYASMFLAAGFEILHESADVDSGALESLNKMPLARRFSGYARHDLAAITSRFVLRSPGQGP